MVVLTAELRCRYVATGSRPTEVPRLHLFSVALDGRGDEKDEARAAASLVRDINDCIVHGFFGAVVLYPRQVARVVAASVAGIDFRPIDHDGQRVDSSGETWRHACGYSLMTGLLAWFAVTVERHS